MMPVCPKCGKEIKYITPPNTWENAVYIVDAAEDHLISNMGRVIKGYREHICAMSDRTAEDKGDGDKNAPAR